MAYLLFLLQRRPCPQGLGQLIAEVLQLSLEGLLQLLYRTLARLAVGKPRGQGGQLGLQRPLLILQ